MIDQTSFEDARIMDSRTRLLSESETMSIIERIESLRRGGGYMHISVAAFWNGELRWARNQASMASDRRDLVVFVGRHIRGGRGSASTNQIDDASLEGVIRAAERQALDSMNDEPKEMMVDVPRFSRPQATTWSDATFGRTAPEDGKFVQEITEQAGADGFLSAGYLESQGGSVGSYLLDEYERKRTYYDRQTQAQCSVTVRHPKGTASGWAGRSGYDIIRIDEMALARRALDKCRASMNPVRIEPGRYTTILEPQAVADLVNLMMYGLAMSRGYAEKGNGPFVLGIDDSVNRWRSKLGLKVVDERITISHDPSNPEMGIVPIWGLRPVTWIEHGVLKTMNYDRAYALNELNDNLGVISRMAYQMSGGTTTIEEMITNTKRGLLVTRFSNPRLLDQRSLLSTGVTRDGLWLIEDGKISKAVRNFRFTESPLFVLNNVEQLGVPEPIFNPNLFPKMMFALQPQAGLHPVIVPPLKVNDFSFTSTIDAI